MTQNFEKFKNANLHDLLFAGRFGIEIEEHRVQTGRKSLSQHPHSTNLGDRKTQPYFQTDFSESQEEVVTATKHTSKDALNHLHELQTILADELFSDEIIWPLSMPPYMSPDDIDYLVTHFERPWYQNYRDVLIKRYGPYQHIMTGVHVNFSLADALIKWFGAEKQIQSFPVAKNTLYFQIAQQVANYRWLLTYLFGASPVTENVTDNLPRDFKDIEPVRSWRASNFGFVNHFDQQIDYTDLSTYIGQIKHFVKTGDYYDKSEFYGPVRLKAPGSLDDLRQRGTAYLEFRMFDINPFSLDGISQNELSFLHLLIIDSIMNPQEWSNAATKEARMLNHVVATQHPNDSLSASLDQEIEPLFSRLNKIVNFSPIELREDFSRSLIFAEKALKNPELTIGAQLSKHIDNHSLTQFALSRGQQILSERKIIDNNFVFTPSHLKQMYIQAHKLGFKTLVLDNQNLQVSYKNHVQSFKNNEDLTKYMQTKK